MKKELEIVKVNVAGDIIEAGKDVTGTVHVVVKRVCEALGIADQGQAAKLKKLPWATTTMIVVVAEDGKKRETFCLDLRSLPMWLATIHPSKVRPAVREKLISFQREAADVLAEHFLGKRGTSDDMRKQFINEIAELRSEVSRIALQNGTIGIDGAKLISERVLELAQWMFMRGSAPSIKSAQTRIRQQLCRDVEWGGSGREWHWLPSQRFGEALAILKSMRNNMLAEAKHRSKAEPSNVVQLVLPGLKKAK